MASARIVLEIGMICANTARTKIYLQALIQSGYLPKRVLIASRSVPSRILLPRRISGWRSFLIARNHRESLRGSFRSRIIHTIPGLVLLVKL